MNVTRGTGGLSAGINVFGCVTCCSSTATAWLGMEDRHSKAGTWNKSLSGEARQALSEDGISDSAGTGSDS